MTSGFHRLLIASAMISLAFSGTVSGEQELSGGHVLIIGIDGLRRDALLAAETPNLKSLIEHGAFASNTQILSERYQKNDTVSGPGWSSFLTGVWADKHGVNDNSFEGRNYEEFPHLFVRFKEQFPKAKTASFVDWEPIDKFIVGEADTRKVYPAKGAEGYTENDRVITQDAVQHLGEGDSDLVMVYLGAVDETGHRYGFHPDVPEYEAAIEMVDEHVGRLLRAMQSRKHFLKENWLVLVSTDHGGLGTGHGGGHDKPEIRNTFLIVSGAAAKRGAIEEQTYVVDPPVTALVHLGVRIQPEWLLDGKAVGLKAALSGN